MLSPHAALPIYFLQTPFDQLRDKPKSMPVHEPGSLTSSPGLPASGWAAILRGLRGHCPRCGEARLFMRFLKPIPRCPQCAQDWTHQQADDFPAYVRSEEHTSELQSLMRISYAVFCLKKKKKIK